MMVINYTQPQDDTLLRHTFVLLAATESGTLPNWHGPEDLKNLRTRVEVLAQLLDFVPETQLGRLADVMTTWRSQFPRVAVVPAKALRQAAHSVLRESSRGRENRSSADAIRRVETILDSSFTPYRNDELGEPSAVSANLCARALLAWHKHLAESPEWAYLPGVVPGDSPTRIEEVYIELYAHSKDGYERTEPLQSSASSRMCRGRQDASAPSIGVAAMVARTLEICVITGEPGSGKSTLIRWLAWATKKDLLRDFDEAIVVQLRDYAAALSRRPDLTPVEFFLQSMVPREKDFGGAAECLRQAGARRRRILLLLDGWDEVPVSQRELTRRNIQEESGHFVTVITSRASGLPWQIFPKGTVNYYEIAGLAPQSIRLFVEKQLRLLGPSATTVAKNVIGTIESDADLRGMATNPFVLGLLVRVLSEPGQGYKELTRAQLFHRISDWVVEHHRETRASAPQIVGGHLQALERLAFRLLFKEDSPRYTFRRQELESTLERLEADPLDTSRFITRPDSASDSWGFLHATIEEYFAAAHLAALPEPEFRENWDRAFCSQSRLVALEFLAGFGTDGTRKSAKRAEWWLTHPDRFGLTLIRLARLGVAGKWVEQQRELTDDLFDKLWKQITVGDDWQLSRRFLEALAALDALELTRRASSNKQGDNRIWETICDLLPLDVIQDGGLYDVLPKSLRDTLTLRSPVQVHLDEMLSNLADDSLSTVELLRVVDQATLCRDRAVAEALLKRLRFASDDVVRTRIVMALAAVFGELPLSTLLILLIEEHTLPPTISQLASVTLCHAEKCGEMLDPDGRDILLRRLAIISPHDERVETILTSLRNFPIRTGGSLIAELALSAELDPMVRSIALQVLHTVSDAQTLQMVVNSMLSEATENIVHALLTLASKRNIPLPSQWLEARIRSESNSFQRRELLRIYIGAMSTRPHFEQAACRRFLAKRIKEVLFGGSDESEAYSFELAHALNATVGSARLFSNVDNAPNVIDFLNHFISDRGGVLASQLLLATALIRRSSNSRSVELLRPILDTVISWMRRENDKRLRLGLEAVALAIAQALAERSADHLLSYGPECAPVREVLGGLARESGWMVFHDHILDANGCEVASLEHQADEESKLSPEIVQKLFESLPPSPRSAVKSFCRMTVYSDICDRNSTYKTIHAMMRRIVAGRKGSDARDDELSDIYPNKLPTLGAWIQSMSRAMRKLSSTQNGRAFLSELGLPRQHR